MPNVVTLQKYYFHLNRMTIQAAFTHLVNTLTPLYAAREATNIAHLVMEHITGFGKMDRIVKKDQPLAPAQQQQLEQAAAALLEHQPVQYVTGTAWFCGMELMVNNQVLIPRPETEELVDWIIREGKHGAGLRLLDIGTGSGCIPLAIKKEWPQAEVWALDVSTGALEVARANALKQRLDIHFQQTDILDTAAAAELPDFDIIVSNPPYIRQSERSGMQQQVWAYEPALALFVPDNDALLFYRRIALLALEKLRAGGRLYFEINEALGHEVVELLRQQGFEGVVLKQDIFGKDRMVKGLNRD